MRSTMRSCQRRVSRGMLRRRRQTLWGVMSEGRPSRVLMVYPRFVADTFWSFTESCRLMGARRPAAPLGLITVAALLPASWPIRLVDCNTEALDDADIAWADLIFTGGM